MSSERGYRKGDEHSGGGGSNGGGGKMRRPQKGWEKGDVARDVDMHDDTGFQIKPGRDPDRKAELKEKRRERDRKERDEEKREAAREQRKKAERG